jgi:hypothetical protein
LGRAYYLRNCIRGEERRWLTIRGLKESGRIAANERRESEWERRQYI